MTEEQWLACDDPRKMNAFLRGSGRANERKVRLFAVACCRRIWPWLTDPRSREAVEVAERFADGRASLQQLHDARHPAEEAYDEADDALDAIEASTAAVPVARYHEAILGLEAVAAAAGAALDASDDYTLELANAADFAAAFDFSPSPLSAGDCGSDSERAEQAALLRDIIGPFAYRPLPAVQPSWLLCHDGAVGKLSQAAYDQRLLPSGELDFARLAVLADALEDAGCADAAILAHCRQPGEHVRGCWVVDLLLNKA